MPYNYLPFDKYLNDLWEFYQSSSLRLDFRENTFSDNAMGGFGAVTKLEGFPAIVVEGDLYTRNENWFEPIFYERSLLSKISKLNGVGPLTRPEQPMLTADYLASYNVKADAVLSITRLSYITLQRFAMVDNYVVDDVNPFEKGIGLKQLD